MYQRERGTLSTKEGGGAILHITVNKQAGQEGRSGGPSPATLERGKLGKVVV
jgi:hypothetical protein